MQSVLIRLIVGFGEMGYEGADLLGETARAAALISSGGSHPAERYLTESITCILILGCKTFPNFQEIGDRLCWQISERF